MQSAMLPIAPDAHADLKFPEAGQRNALVAQVNPADVKNRSADSTAPFGSFRRLDDMMRRVETERAQLLATIAELDREENARRVRRRLAAEKVRRAQQEEERQAAVVRQIRRKIVMENERTEAVRRWALIEAQRAQTVSAMQRKAAEQRARIEAIVAVRRWAAVETRSASSIAETKRQAAIVRQRIEKAVEQRQEVVVIKPDVSDDAAKTSSVSPATFREGSRERHLGKSDFGKAHSEQITPTEIRYQDSKPGAFETVLYRISAKPEPAVIAQAVLRSPVKKHPVIKSVRSPRLPDPLPRKSRPVKVIAEPDGFVIRSRRPIVRTASVKRLAGETKHRLINGFEIFTSRAPGSIKAAWRRVRRSIPADRIEYKRIKHDWFAISWTDDAVSHYVLALPARGEVGTVHIKSPLGDRDKLSRREQRLVANIACSSYFRGSSLPCAKGRRRVRN